MEWWEAFIIIMGALFALMFIGMPVAFTFLTVNLVGAFLFSGGFPGMLQLVIQISESLSTFTLVPVALFLVMGEIMFHSGIGFDLLDTLDKWFGSLKGRLALMAVGGGVLFSALTGNSMGSVALLGSTLVPEMEKRGGGSIVITSSVAGVRGTADVSAYVTSKHAVVGLMRNAALEGAKKKIRVNTVCPTFIETAMTKPFMENKEFMQDILNRIPLGYVGQPEDVAGAVLYLASDASRLVTGSSIKVDGGWTAV